MYFYHAHAIALGGTLGPNPINVEKGSCALAVTGGNSLSEPSSFNSNGIKFQSAKLQVIGSEQSVNGLDVYVTKASASIEKLNIRDVITADKIVAEVSSDYRASDYDATTVVTGSIEGLKINGTPVTVGICDDICHHYATFASMQADFKNTFARDRVLACLVGRGLDAVDANTEDLQAAYQAYKEQNAMPGLKSLVVCSLVNKVSGGGIKSWGPIIQVPGLGRLYLGEVLIWKWMRCLTMFRVVLDSDAGSISGATVGSNGGGFPPGAYNGG